MCIAAPWGGQFEKDSWRWQKIYSEVFSDLLTVFLNMHDSPAISEGVYYMDGSDQEVFPTEQSQRPWMLSTQRQPSEWPSVGPDMEWNKNPTDDRKMIYKACIARELIFLSAEKDQFPNLILYRFFSLGIKGRDSFLYFQIKTAN